MPDFSAARSDPLKLTAPPAGKKVVTLLAAASLLSACSVLHPPESPSSAPPPGTSSAPGTAQPQPAPPPEAVPTPEQPPRPPPKQFKLSPATNALVQQAHTQAHTGAFVPAAATIERALRIEPENPLLWIELGQIRLSENNPSQANAMGHKALALATGDAQAQASAWRLIAESLRTLGRNPEAAEADQKANTLSPR
jgi:predicted Zn-dependent protease